MLAKDFGAGLDTLLACTEEGPVVMMCSEAVWWRCHRRIIADALYVRGIVVEHIMRPGATHPHELTSFARVEALHVTYP